jgi:putative transposase
MPNHVHVVLLPALQSAKIMRWLKGSTAREAHLILGRTGQRFWQEESFDHRVRNDMELERIVRYVEYNPVSAGLVRNAGDWPWSSTQLTGENACPTF